MSRAPLVSLCIALLTGCGGSVELAPDEPDTGSAPVETGAVADAAPEADPGDAAADSASPSDTGTGGESGPPSDGAVVDSGTAAGTKHIVEVWVGAFKPATLEIARGDTVEWVWKAGFHNVVSGPDCSSDGAFASGPPKSTGTYVFEFRGAGTFPYHSIPACSSGMKGTIQVRP